MGSNQEPIGPSNENDEKKMKRMLANRESALRSRLRKQQQLDELTTLEKQLKGENNKLKGMLNDATQLNASLASENNVLRAQLAELTERLRSLHSVLQIAPELNGLGYGVPDILVETWGSGLPNSAHSSFC